MAHAMDKLAMTVELDEFASALASEQGGVA
jgi:hypothetical protein